MTQIFVSPNNEHSSEVDNDWQSDGVNRTHANKHSSEVDNDRQSDGVNRTHARLMKNDRNNKTDSNIILAEQNSLYEMKPDLVSNLNMIILCGNGDMKRHLMHGRRKSILQI